jgi:2-succinyl-6-hydroxy-2,4-cyclohexadiene-1-carboxylate synthase
MGSGAQAPLHDALPGMTMPALILAGALDQKFVATGQEMASAVPRATFAAIPDAGHAAHTEQPEATARLVIDFLHRQKEGS